MLKLLKDTENYYIRKKLAEKEAIMDTKTRMYESATGEDFKRAIEGKPNCKMELIDVLTELEKNVRKQTRLLEEQIALMKRMIEILEEKK